MAFNRTLITAALPYANGPVHIGHLAGVYVPADIYARYLRLKGQEVLFVCGSDEHGVPVTIRARKEGITTQQVVDRYHSLIKRSFADFGVSFDIYSRTTSDIHHRFAADYFRAMYDAGQFVEETSEQFYDPETGHFLTDRNIRGECPRCHSLGAYGDQCEKCGATLSPDEPKPAMHLLRKRPNTGTCRSTNIRHGSRIGFSITIKNGVRTYTGSARVGWMADLNRVP